MMFLTLEDIFTATHMMFLALEHMLVLRNMMSGGGVGGRVGLGCFRSLHLHAS